MCAILAAIYLSVNPSVSPDGSFMAFEWNDRVWLAPTMNDG